MAKFTDKEFIEYELKNGISLDNPLFLDLARNTIKQLEGYGKTILDYGCGVGAYSKAAIDLGYDVIAYEKFKSHREYLKNNLPELKVGEIKSTDILLFIETAEHMTDSEINSIFNKIKPKYILFSSTSTKTDFDEVWGHINVKEQEEWDKYFFGIGYKINKHLTLPTNWSKIYESIN
jgi:2-polyprenyl-3-methyl-5-hydroxy-6-metoxy-1,4-benzoquinol methylase